MSVIEHWVAIFINSLQLRSAGRSFDNALHRSHTLLQCSTCRTTVQISNTYRCSVPTTPNGTNLRIVWKCWRKRSLSCRMTYLHCMMSLPTTELVGGSKGRAEVCLPRAEPEDRLDDQDAGPSDRQAKERAYQIWSVQSGKPNLCPVPAPFYNEREVSGDSAQAAHVKEKAVRLSEAEGR